MNRSKVCEDLKRIMLEIVKVIILFPVLAVISPFVQLINSIIDLIFDVAEQKECDNDKGWCFF